MRNSSILRLLALIPLVSLFCAASAQSQSPAPPAINLIPETAHDTVLCNDAGVYFDTVVVQNIGTSDLVFEKMGISMGKPNPAFSLVENPTESGPFVLPAGEEIILIIRYIPSLIEFDPDDWPVFNSVSFLSGVIFRTNEQNPRYTRHNLLVTQGFDHWYRTGLQGGSDRSKVDFGQVYIGDSAAGEALFVNINDSTVLVIDSLWITPGSADVEVSGGTIELGAPILPGDSVTIGVQFKPTSVDSLESTFLCAQTSEPCVASLCWLLQGEGLPSGILLSESSLWFDAPICWDGSPILDTVLLSNGRQTPYTILDIAVPDGSDFELIEPRAFPITVDSNDEVVVIVRYRPTTRTTTSELIVRSDVPGSESFGIPLRGNSRPVDLSVAVERLDFESHCTASPVSSVLLFSNPGTITDSITFSLASGNSFKVDEGRTLLRPGGIDSVRVTFDPGSTLQASDTLFLVSEPCSVRDTVLLFGRINDQPLSVSHGTISFDNVPVGASDTIDIEFTNTSQGLTLEVTELRVFPLDVGLNISGVAPSLTLSPSSNFNAQVSWLPTTLESLPSGSYLEVVIESPCRDTMRIPIQGTSSP